MTLSLSPRTTLYDTEIARVTASSGVSANQLYLHRTYTVPWSVEPTVFRLTTTDPTAEHEISINREFTTRIRPGAETFDVALPLFKGANRIQVSTRSESIVVDVAATAIGTWFYGLGREYYLSISARLNEVKDQINSPWTTRLSAHLLAFQDLLARARMPKIHSTKLLIRQLVGRSGFADGVVSFASALGYQTPPVRKILPAIPGLESTYPVVFTAPTTAEHYAGREFHMWTPNYCLAVWNALLRLANNLNSEDTPAPKPMEIVDVSDIQLLLRFAGGATEAHRIDPGAFECSVIDNFLGCGNITAFASSNATFDIVQCEPQIPFDAVVERPLGFGFFDEDSQFDGTLNASGTTAIITGVLGDLVTLTGLTGLDATVVGRVFEIAGAAVAPNNGLFRVNTFISPTSVLIENAGGVFPDANSGSIQWRASMGPGLGGDNTFDTVDPDDPFGTGYAGFGLSGRFDGDHCLDTVAHRARRLVQHTEPLRTISGATPNANRAVGMPLAVDVKTISPPAPSATLGTSVFWASCPQTYVVEGDWIRLETPDVDLQVLSAVPVRVAQTGATIVAVAAGSLTVGGLTGISPADVGRKLALTGADNVGNNGVFEITAWISPTSVVVAAPLSAFPDANSGTIEWSVFTSSQASEGNYIVKSSTAADYFYSGCDKLLRAPPGFFEPGHVGMGVDVVGSAAIDGRFTIAEVYEDGLAMKSCARVVGRTVTTVSDPGPFTIFVYAPLRDRQPAGSDSAGRVLFEITATTALPRDLVDGESTDLRRGVRSQGVWSIADTVIEVTTDVYPLPGDLLWLDTTVSRRIDLAYKVGFCELTKLPIWELHLTAGIPAGLTDQQFLYAISGRCCWENGLPVTPLALTAMAPATYLS